MFSSLEYKRVKETQGDLKTVRIDLDTDMNNMGIWQETGSTGDGKRSGRLSLSWLTAICSNGGGTAN